MPVSPINIRPDVLHVCEACAGGVRRHLELVLPALHKRGLKQGLFAFSARADSDFMLLLEQLQDLDCAVDYLDLHPALSLSGLFNAARCLQAMIDELQPRTLHLHSGWAGILGRLPLFGIRHKCKLYAPHAFGWQSKSLWASLLKPRLEKYLSRHTQAYILVGQEELREAASLGINNDKLFLAENGLPADFAASLWRRQKARQALAIPEDECAVLIPCRLAWQKGLDLLLPALAQNNMTELKLNFHICGDGPEKDALAKLAKKLNLQEKIHFRGNLPGLWQKLRAFDGAILPSRYEGRSYALLECMAAKMPLLCSDIPANMLSAEVLSFKAGDQESLGRGLTELQSKLGQVINYEPQTSLEEQTEQLISAYETAAGT